MRSPARTCDRSGPTGSTTRRQVRPIGSGPFLVERWERGRAARARAATPTTGGRIPRTSTGSSSGSATASGDPAEALLSGERDVDVCGLSRQSVAAGPPALPGFNVCRVVGRVGALRVPDRHRRPSGAPQNKLVRRALAYGIDRDAIVRRSSGSSTRLSAERQRRVPDTEPPLPAELERLPLPPGPWRAACSSRRAAAAARTASTSAPGERLSLRFVTTAGSAAPRASPRARPGTAPAGRHRGRAQLRARLDPVRPDPPERRRSTSLSFAWVDSRTQRLVQVFGCGG